MKITCLIENLSENPDMICEHGLSFFIEKDDYKILFDTGSTGKFVDNAFKMNINLEKLDAVIISHGHYDHGGGLKSLLMLNKDSPVYLKESADGDYFLKYLIFFKRYIGLDKKLLKKNSDQLIFLDKNTEIIPHIHLITTIKSEYMIPTGNKYLFQKKNNKLIKDNFSHELMMVIEEINEIIIITGCSHHGILNMVETAMNIFPEKRIKAVFGGFHLIGSPILKNIADSEIQIKYLAEKLLEYPIDKIYTGHCTGEAYFLMKEVMNDKLEYFATSNIVNLD